MKNLLVIAHTNYKNDKIAAGPYSTVLDAINIKFDNVESIKVPLFGYKPPVVHGNEETPQKLEVPGAIGTIAPLKYIFDLLITFVLAIKFHIKYKDQENVVIGADPLAALPAGILKKVFGGKFIFYSVDFNEKRFANPLLQKLYELADEWSSKLADQVWGVCDSLNEYKKTHYGVDAIYIPNAFAFNDKYYKKHKDKKQGNKVVWIGSILTDKQVVDILRLCTKIQEIRKDMKFLFLPVNKKGLFEKEVEKIKLKNAKVLDVDREMSFNMVAQCDLGLALYNKDFGSTKYIEPLKIWDYMMTGTPFIISCEPSLNPSFVQEGIALLMKPDNDLPNDIDLESFISKTNLESLRDKCIEMAKRYDAIKTMGSAIDNLKKTS